MGTCLASVNCRLAGSVEHLTMMQGLRAISIAGMVMSKFFTIDLYMLQTSMA